MPSAFPRPSPRSEVRLQKYLADCGFGSRRACEILISEGRVAVGGRAVVEQGVRIDPDRADVTVDGRPARRERIIHVVLHKPAGFLCTSRDPHGRRTFHELLPPDLGARVYSAGRLDWDSEGLLLVTNDGDLAHRLIHPRHHVEKTYRVWTPVPLDPAWLARFTSGVDSEGERLAARSVREVGRDRQGAYYEMVLGTGRNRQIRRMFEVAGLPVLRLLRTRFGPLDLGDLPPGRWRPVTDTELAALRDLAGA
ncbi:MAG: rRNA pseudouridine synthase [Lentisphaerae bacterium]|nr:rRNA pseudouridine synthase [Lentisphaerota bacterium]